MRCPNCGAQIGKFENDTYTCEYCRSTYHASELDPDWKNEESPSSAQEIHHYHHQKAPDKLSTGLGCLCFFFFPIGWIIYFLYKDSSPKKAKTAMIIAAVMTAIWLFGIALGNSPAD